MTRSRIEAPSRIEAALEAAAREDGASLALVDGDRHLSFSDLASLARGAAAKLRAAGVEPGDRVMLLQRKTAQSVAWLYGTWMAGAIAVPTSVELRSAQLEHVLTNSGAKVIVAATRELEELDADVAVLDPDDEHSDDEHTAPFIHEDLTTAPAAILYTSGSTGMPKGILISHENFVAGARIVSKYLEITARDRILSVLPFHFDYGLNQLLTTVRQRATLVLQRSTMPAAILRTLQEEAITGLAGVPPLWVQLMGPGSPLAAGGLALPALRYVTNSGGAFPVPLLRRYREALPETKIFLMYGLSEAFRSSYLPPEELDQKLGAMGRAIPETELLVLDADGQPCPDGETGELVHRGPTVALGYWQDARATVRVFRPDPDRPGERVVYSGDTVRREADGTLYYVGRTDQRLKCFGNRVSPEEVEAAIAPVVREVVVGGVDDEVAGQRVIAHVVLAEGTSEDDVWAHCREAMPRYMQPVQVIVHASFPRTSSGKLARSKVLAG